jgi:hypothetical protein
LTTPRASCQRFFFRFNLHNETKFTPKFAVCNFRNLSALIVIGGGYRSIAITRLLAIFRT